MASGVKITFKVGDRRWLSKPGDSDAQATFVTEMGKEVTRIAANNVSVDVPRLQRTLDNRITNSLKQAVTFAAMNMMGVKSNINTQGRAAPTNILFNMGKERGEQGEGDRPIINPSKLMRDDFGSQGFELQWQALSRRTIIQKTRTQGRERARKFFVDTGDLQKEIKELAENIVDRTGTVKVMYAKSNTAKSLRVMKNQGRVRVGQLQLRFLPKIKIRTLKGFMAEDPTYTDGSTAFEESLKLTPATLKKLQGEEGYHRPLLQPIFSYWMLTRIPGVVAKSISSAVRTR